MPQQVTIPVAGGPNTVRPKRQPFTNSELVQFTQDPDYTPADLKLLSPEEMTRLQAIQDRKSPTGVATDVMTGVGQGFFDTSMNLGKVIHSTPGLGDLTDKLSKQIAPMLGGDERTDPKAAFANLGEAKTQLGLDPENTAQRVGKVGEQVAEFFIPANATREAMTQGLIKLIPDGASPEVVRLANRVIAHTTRVLGDAASATGVAAAHGDEHPERAGMVAGGSTAAMEELAPMAVKLMRTKYGSKLAPLLMAIGTMKVMGGVTPESMGAGFGVYHLVQGLSEDAVNAMSKVRKSLKPVIGARPEAAMGLGQKIGQIGAATESANDTKQPSLRRRRIQETMQP